MNTMFMNSKNSKTSNPHRLLANLKDQIDLKRKDKYITLSNLSIYNTSKNIKKLHRNNKFKISASTWNKEFELPTGSYSLPNIQDYFETILKKHREKTANHSIRIYVNKIENRIKFKTKTEYYPELVIPEMIKLLGSNKTETSKDVVKMCLI